MKVKLSIFFLTIFSVSYIHLAAQPNLIPKDWSHVSTMLGNKKWQLYSSNNHSKRASNPIGGGVLKGNEKLVSEFFLTGASNTITMFHHQDAATVPITWNLYYSIDSGKNWIVFKNKLPTGMGLEYRSAYRFKQQTPVKIAIEKTGTADWYIDSLKITGRTEAAFTSTPTPSQQKDPSIFGNPNYCSCTNDSDTIPTRDDNLAMGNPSNATSNTTDSNNFLITKNQYVLSYNNKLGVANWVSWHLSSAWKGSVSRCDCFTIDTALPTGYNKVSTSKYTNTGFDRGHLCPSDDRDSTALDNKATFYMTNITPQAPVLNQQTWGDLEDYSRKLITQGKELYIIAGGYGSGGTGSNGGVDTSIASNTIRVYAYFWKVVVVLSTGKNDVSRVDTNTRVIAVAMPNNQTVNSNNWGYYRTSVDAIESATGLDLLSNVSTSVQSVIESKTDNGPVN